MNVIGDVKGKTCIIVDDIIDSGGTIVNAAAFTIVPPESIISSTIIQVLPFTSPMTFMT